MNERIKELAEQAGFFVLSDDKIYIPTTSEEITDCQTKFAELIVKECASICRDRKLTPSAFTADELLEHFGVE